MSKKNLDKEIAASFAQLSEHMREANDPALSVRHFRKIARLARELAIHIRIGLKDIPWLESWWQEYRLERGLHDRPTLYIFAKELDGIAKFYDWMADEVIKARKRASKRKA